MNDEICRIPLMVKPIGDRLLETRFENRFVGSCDFYSAFLDWSGALKEIEHFYASVGLLKDKE